MSPHLHSIARQQPAEVLQVHHSYKLCASSSLYKVVAISVSCKAYSLQPIVLLLYPAATAQVFRPISYMEIKQAQSHRRTSRERSHRPGRQG